jgi:hypothetical protein
VIESGLIPQNTDALVAEICAKIKSIMLTAEIEHLRDAMHVRLEKNSLGKSQ